MLNKLKVVWSSRYLCSSVSSLRSFRSDFPTMVLSPAESAAFVMKHARNVTINPEGISVLSKEICQGLRDGTISIANFSQHQYHPDAADARAPNWLFLIDTLNFCFWTPDDATKWRVNGATGYFALCAAIKRALDDGIDLTNPRFYAQISAEQLATIMRSDDGVTSCPLLAERVRCLHEVGTQLVAKYDGDFAVCVRSAAGSAQRLLRTIVDEFPCFRDEAEYNGQQISLYKRAQIAIGDLWACYRGRGLGEFADIEAITMFADYRVPQVLVHFGTMSYSEELRRRLDADELLENGTADEVEIRAASIHVVELLRDEVVKELTATGEKLSVNSILLDHFLWDYRRRFEGTVEFVPFHKTIGIYY